MSLNRGRQVRLVHGHGHGPAARGVACPPDSPAGPPSPPFASLICYSPARRLRSLSRSQLPCNCDRFLGPSGLFSTIAADGRHARASHPGLSHRPPPSERPRRRAPPWRASHTAARPGRGRGGGGGGAGGPHPDAGGPGEHAGVLHVLEHPNLLRPQRRRGGPRAPRPPPRPPACPGRGDGSAGPRCPRRPVPGGDMAWAGRFSQEHGRHST